MKRFAWSGAPLLPLSLVAATGLGGCISTATYGTGEAPEMAIFREVTGSVGRAPKQPIQYQPRAPLVMPPTAGALPQPVDTTAIASTEWPRDPDQQPAPGSDYGDGVPRDDITPEYARRLKPLAGMGNPDWDNSHMDAEQPAYDIIINREQRKVFKAALDDAEGVGRTERRYLTDPPETFREPAATAPAEFDDIKKKRGSFLTRLFTG